MIVEACDDCLRRTELLGWLSGRIEIEWRLRRGRPQLLALSDEDLLDWSRDSAARTRYQAFAPSFVRDRLTAAGLGAICRCAAPYPVGLLELPDPPAVLHVLGDAGVLTDDGVALVGARDASPYGEEISRRLARSLAIAGVTVVSGMAMGVDAAAHEGALEALRLRARADRVPGVGAPASGPVGRTIAVLATGADRPYPVRFRALHAEIASTGCVVSEMPPGSAPRRWAFPARNRLIAGLSRGTVVIEGGERSGSLITADFAADLGRFVAAVPGPVTSRLSAGPHALLKAGAEVVRSTADVLDLVGAADGFGPVAHTVIGSGEPSPDRRLAPLPDRATPPPDLPPALRRLLMRVEQGQGSLAELVSAPEDGFAVSRDLGELEVRGLIRRVSGGRYIRALD